MSDLSIFIPARPPKETFEATVALDESGTHTSIAAAVASGAKSILVRNGTYVQSADLVIPSYTWIIGETLGQTVIDFNNTAFSVKITGLDYAYTNPGTVSTTHGSAIVTGSGTSFTDLQPGYIINIRGVPHTVAAIASDTQLTVAVPFMGRDVSGAKYVAGRAAGGDILMNIVIARSTSYGLVANGINDSGLAQVGVIGCGGGFNLINCGVVYVRNCLFRFCAGPAVRLERCRSCKVTESAMDADGLLGGEAAAIVDSELITVAECRVRGCGGDGVLITNSTDIHVVDTVFSDLFGNAVSVDGLSSLSALTNCTVENCGAIGAVTGTSSVYNMTAENNGAGLVVNGASTVHGFSSTGVPGSDLVCVGAGANVNGCRVATGFDISGATSVVGRGNRVAGSEIAAWGLTPLPACLSAEATASTNTSSSSYSLMNSMTLTPGAGTYLVTFGCHVTNDALISPTSTIMLYVGGVAVAGTERTMTGNSNPNLAVSKEVTAGASDAIEVRWKTGGTGTSTAQSRILTCLSVA